MIPSRYILFYSLTADDQLVYEALRISSERKIPVLSVHPLCKNWCRRFKNLKDVGPSEFIWLIMNAEMIITNYFHGTAFSVIFKKDTILSFNDKLGERNKDLLDLLKIKLSKYDEVNFSEADYQKLNELTQCSKAYLKESLDSQKKA